MNELIRIKVNENQEQIVSAREMHEKLEIKQDFTSWIKYQFEKLGLIENIDYALLTNFGEQTGRGGHNKIDYHIAIDIAKHLAMISGGEKAHEIRQYFIQVEKNFKQQSVLSPIQILEHQLQIMKEHERKLSAIETKVENIKDTIVSTPDHWRDDINRMINKIVKAVGNQDFSRIRTESYALLERRAGVNLNQRLANMRNRLYLEGASQSKVKNINNMDVIELDKKLREIYLSIVKEYYIKHCA